MKSLFKLETIIFIIITLFGVFNGQVTVFYIVYFFWFQELIRTVIDFLYILKTKTNVEEKISFIRTSTGSFFILGIYLVFIVVLFGLMLNWENNDLMRQNILVVIFRNWYFNSNLFIFLLQYIYYRKSVDNTTLKMPMFSGRHLILHISIIMGAIIKMIIAPRLNLEVSWTSVLVLVPFLLLKLLLDKPKSTS
jgi:hypothetical protein